MNKNGNPGNLVASHPGNTNAAKYGVYSTGLIQPRAAEIAAHLNESFDFTVAQRVAVEQAARCMAIIEAIDRDLEERGLVGKRGEPRSLLPYRSRISRELDRWLAQLTATIERQSANGLADVGPAEYAAELKRIATGQDTTASARDRISAIKELKATERGDEQPRTVTLVIRRDADGEAVIDDDPPDDLDDSSGGAQ